LIGWEKEKNMDTAAHPTRAKVLRLLEWAFAIFGAVVCLVVVLLFASLQPDQLWPLPGIYFIEVALLGVLVAASRAMDALPGSAAWGAVPWVGAGVLMSFVILGGFSIGPFLFPAMLAFWLAGVFADLRQRRRLAGHLVLAILAALLQGALMLAILFLSQ
jgi:hypothetical protein